VIREEASVTKSSVAEIFDRCLHCILESFSDLRSRSNASILQMIGVADDICRDGESFKAKD
jgi:hypothetical protein